ncbi:hypothetical protein PGT21_036479 [Puccinia graminis f. sp. tritici]|uniref:Uncharacterized protein n=1 Tax=Puccinia graminis f. sp. tritici TaxID=56615 RepID=A0A5B0Q0N2_PUCGR|nr:hypothetical protein PGT21_036479 [Puccinia graminis f. sp. tritici]KAA1126204.1 hypothetical protein PGTUg99_012997 [Puccinia graminis f. sp. tritici]KAA1132469.1 hypothetical protein PGTUg99_013276 [Puccinia graminis f. sp. tritici]
MSSWPTATSARAPASRAPQEVSQIAAATRRPAAAAVHPSCLSTLPTDAHVPLQAKLVAAQAVLARALRSLELVALRNN